MQYCRKTRLTIVLAAMLMAVHSPSVQAAVNKINTFKKFTHRFDGLGFAISIEVAMDAFDAI